MFASISSENEILWNLKGERKKSEACAKQKNEMCFWVKNDPQILLKDQPENSQICFAQKKAKRRETDTFKVSPDRLI